MQAKTLWQTAGLSHGRCGHLEHHLPPRSITPFIPFPGSQVLACAEPLALRRVRLRLPCNGAPAVWGKRIGYCNVSRSKFPESAGSMGNSARPSAASRLELPATCAETVVTCAMAPAILTLAGVAGVGQRLTNSCRGHCSPRRCTESQSADSRTLAAGDLRRV
jgi:hypothetical protein